MLCKLINESYANVFYGQFGEFGDESMNLRDRDRLRNILNNQEFFDFGRDGSFRDVGSIFSCNRERSLFSADVGVEISGPFLEGYVILSGTTQGHHDVRLSDSIAEKTFRVVDIFLRRFSL